MFINHGGKMKLFKTKSAGVEMLTIKGFINLSSVSSATLLIMCVWIAFALGCSAEGNINGISPCIRHIILR
jgi:hypothetical protein